MARIGAFLAFFLLFTLQAATVFPALSGRVVDEAALLSPAQRAALTAELAGLESATTNQLVVVTLKSLQGYDIADYGYRLGRYWGIGQKGKDNGVLLIVAPNERKVRIEVGYGLEGVLTDYLCKQIIEGSILPAFKKGDYAGGITAGTSAIISRLSGRGGAPTPPNTPPVTSDDPLPKDMLFFLGFIFIIAATIVSTVIDAEGNAVRSAVVAFFPTAVLYALMRDVFAAIFVFVFIFLMAYARKRGQFSGFGSGDGGFGGGSFGGGGGFSGGGGSFGGGGASGSW